MDLHQLNLGLVKNDAQVAWGGALAGLGKATGLQGQKLAPVVQPKGLDSAAVGARGNGIHVDEDAQVLYHESNDG